MKTIGFLLKDNIHRIVVRFVQAFLPNAKEEYYLRAAFQTELDIHGIALKAAVYNMTTSPAVIEEGLNAGMELIYYLVADGYRIKTPLFNVRIRIPGEYKGNETSLPEGIFPVARLQTSTAFRKYLKEKVNVVIGGFEESKGQIAEVLDEATGLKDKVMTIGHILTIRGSRLKIEGDEAHKDKVGVFFKPKSGASVKAQVIAVNHPQTLKVLVPNGLKKGMEYHIVVGTQSSKMGSGTILTKVRDITSKTAFKVA